jgi:hypothetical protein
VTSEFSEALRDFGGFVCLGFASSRVPSFYPADLSNTWEVSETVGLLLATKIAALLLRDAALDNAGLACDRLVMMWRTRCWSGFGHDPCFAIDHRGFGRSTRIQYCARLQGGQPRRLRSQRCFELDDQAMRQRRAASERQASIAMFWFHQLRPNDVPCIDNQRPRDPRRAMLIFRHAFRINS